MEQKIYLKGLNSLRFIAAGLVVFGHAKDHLLYLNIKWHPDAEVLKQAGSAVRFFFVLSGFLLTMIALRELKKDNFIHLKSFYLRRVLRIFPLYYAVLIAVIIINAGINPILLHKNTLGQPVIEGFLMNAFMLPNLAKAIWPETVGALGLLWSVGVEEQFYLFFPHLMNFMHKIKHGFLVLLLVFITLFTFFRLVATGFIVFHPVLQEFIITLRFDYMLIGCLFSYIIFASEAGKKILTVANLKPVQVIVYAIALADMFFSIIPKGTFGMLMEPVLFGLVIICVSCTTNSLLNFEIQPFTHWGAISYGIYLLHPFVAYLLRFAFIKVAIVEQVIRSVPDLYAIVLLTLTIALAHFSYKYYESPFLTFKDNLNRQQFAKLFKGMRLGIPGRVKRTSK